MTIFHCIGPWFHDWTRPFWDKELEYEYYVCVRCGRRQRSEEPYTKKTVYGGRDML